MVKMYLLDGAMASDCYYKNLNLPNFSHQGLRELLAWAYAKDVQLLPFPRFSRFKKSKYDFTPEEFATSLVEDFYINEAICNTPVVLPDGNIYFCPGFFELNEPICSIGAYEEHEFKQKLEDLYYKPLAMCTDGQFQHINRYCRVRDKCNKKKCYYLNRLKTGENRFPFSSFCSIKERVHMSKADQGELDILMLVLSSLAKVNEALLTIAMSSPNNSLKTQLFGITGELAKNAQTILQKLEGEKNAEEGSGNGPGK